MSASHPISGYTLTFPAYLCAETIHIVGDFNGWNQHSHPLRRTATGEWMIVWPPHTRCKQFYLLLDRTRWLTVDSIDFLLLERWQALPPSTLFTWAGQSMAIGQLLAWIERWCDALAYVGVAKGAVVALPPANSPIALALLLALFRRRSAVLLAQALFMNELPRQVEWVIQWQADGTARYIRCHNPAAHRVIHRLRSLGHPALLCHTAQDQRQVGVIDVIDYWMPSEFRHLLQIIQGGFSSNTSSVCSMNALPTIDQPPVATDLRIEFITTSDSRRRNLRDWNSGSSFALALARW